MARTPSSASSWAGATTRAPSSASSGEHPGRPGLPSSPLRAPDEDRVRRATGGQAVLELSRQGDGRQGPLVEQSGSPCGCGQVRGRSWRPRRPSQRPEWNSDTEVPSSFSTNSPEPCEGAAEELEWGKRGGREEEDPPAPLPPPPLPPPAEGPHSPERAAAAEAEEGDHNEGQHHDRSLHSDNTLVPLEPEEEEQECSLEGHSAKVHAQVASPSEDEAAVEERQRLAQWEAELRRQEKEAQQRRIQEKAELAQLDAELAKRAKELDDRANELAGRERDMEVREREVVKMEKILEIRSKNLGMNAKRKTQEAEERKRLIAQEAMKEVEEVRIQQEDELRRQQEEVEKRKLGIKQEALKEVEDVKRRVEREQRKVEQERAEAARQKEEAMRVALGLEAPAPGHWVNRSMEPQRNVLVPWRRGSDALQSLLQQAAVHGTCAGRDGTFEVARVRRVKAWRVENPILWRQYRSKAAELQERQKVSGASCKPLEPAVPRIRPPHGPSLLHWWETSDDANNEVMLWHGTKTDIVDIITRDGFDERVCSLDGMFGAGLYFAQESCKSGQYAQRDSRKSHWFLLCRVLLGRVYYTRDAMTSARKAPDGHDSVVFNPGGRGTATGHHREFIVYDRYQAYPEYVVQAMT